MKVLIGLISKHVLCYNLTSFRLEHQLMTNSMYLNQQCWWRWADQRRRPGHSGVVFRTNLQCKINQFLTQPKQVTPLASSWRQHYWQNELCTVVFLEYQELTLYCQKYTVTLADKDVFTDNWTEHYKVLRWNSYWYILSENHLMHLSALTQDETIYNAQFCSTSEFPHRSPLPHFFPKV